ncbi:VOC family protein [Pseudorhodoferax sp.]|uniref:VOC family protein n=1 Tax=Pseudorhodoferax sp. TaxID=1993553 RepID=UPI002DD66632|nr:VOC family protein [Pseudorhodoferax sp.]
MPQHAQIFVNLPIKDMARSQAFFRSLGYEFNPQFTNEQGASLVLGENLFAMLLVEPFFQSFTKKTIVDAHQSVEVLVCLSCSGREEIDDLVRKARAGGATVPNEPQDYGFMYSHGFTDLDGHVWELVHMTGEPPQA